MTGIFDGSGLMDTHVSCICGIHITPYIKMVGVYVFHVAGSCRPGSGTMGMKLYIRLIIYQPERNVDPGHLFHGICTFKILRCKQALLCPCLELLQRLLLCDLKRNDLHRAFLLQHILHQRCISAEAAHGCRRQFICHHLCTAGRTDITFHLHGGSGFALGLCSLLFGFYLLRFFRCFLLGRFFPLLRISELLLILFNGKRRSAVIAGKLLRFRIKQHRCAAGRTLIIDYHE